MKSLLGSTGKDGSNFTGTGYHDGSAPMNLCSDPSPASRGSFRKWRFCWSLGAIDTAANPSEGSRTVAVVL